MRTTRETIRGTDGFTLIELLIVIIIVAILAAIALPVYANQRDKAKEAAVKEGSHQIQNAVVAYAVDHGGAYPATDYVTYTPGDRTADNLGNRYLDTWPRNPWTGQPMKNTGSNVLFNTDFASLNGLTSLQGTWAVVNGQLVPTGSGENRIAFGSTGWTDVELDLSATLNAGRGFGVYYRSDGKANISGYCFQYDPGLGNKFVVRKVNGGSESAPVASFNMPAGFNVYGAQHDIVIKVVGDKHVIAVDGQQVLSFSDSTYKTGSAGLRSWDGGSSVSFASAKALGSGAGSAGSGDPSKGDFAYAYDGQTPSYGLVGWLAAGSAFVIQPLQ
jgi:prepilin-type N-terminal cleavage/methylation domain-containing protein